MTARRANPFLFGRPVSGDGFYGREALLRQLLDCIRKRQPCSIVGERRTGKTSTLRRVESILRDEIDADGKYWPLFVDCQRVVHAEDVWHEILEQARDAKGPGIRLPAPEPPGGDARTARKGVIQLATLCRDAGSTMVLLLDEIEFLAKDEQPRSTVLPWLRSFITGDLPVACVTTSRRGLADLDQNSDFVSSPFFNVFLTLHLGAMQPNEAEQLLESKLRGTDVSFRDYEAAALRLHSGLHPFFLQMAASYLFDRRQNTTPGEDVVRAALREFARQCDPHFGFYWDNSSDREQQLLSLLARRAPIDLAAHRLTIDRLLDRALVVPRSGPAAFRLFSRSFGQWINSRETARGADQDRGPSEPRPKAELSPPWIAGADTAPGRVVLDRIVDPLPRRSIRDLGAVQQRLQALRDVDERSARDSGLPRYDDVQPVDNKVVFRFEPIRGIDLASVVRDRGPIAPRFLAPVAARVAEILESAHEVGVLHQNIEPHHLFISEDEQPLVLGFELACTKRDGAESPAFSAAFGRHNGHSTKQDDVRAFAATFWYLATGELPAAKPAQTDSRRHWRHRLADGFLAALKPAIAEVSDAERLDLGTLRKRLLEYGSAMTYPGCGASIADNTVDSVCRCGVRDLDAAREAQVSQERADAALYEGRFALARESYEAARPIYLRLELPKHVAELDSRLELTESLSTRHDALVSELDRLDDSAQLPALLQRVETLSAATGDLPLSPDLVRRREAIRNALIDAHRTAGPSIRTALRNAEFERARQLAGNLESIAGSSAALAELAAVGVSKEEVPYSVHEIEQYEARFESLDRHLNELLALGDLREAREFLQGDSIQPSKEILPAARSTRPRAFDSRVRESV